MIKPIGHPRYKKITDNSDYFFFVNSNSLAEDIAFIKKNEIENVCLSQYDNYGLLDVLPIVDIDCIRKLRIYVKKVDLKGLSRLTYLEDLSVGEEYTNLALNNLSNLRSLYLINGKFTGLQTLRSLKELTIINGNVAAFSIDNFMENSSIESLSIYNTKGQIDFSFLCRLKNLRKLDLYNIKTKVDMQLFDSFAETLKELKVEKCKELEHLEDCLFKYNALQYLSLIDSVPISHTETLFQLKSIEIVVVLGTSYFIDGNISQLRELRHASIDDKKHYSLKNDQLPKLPYE